MPSAAFRKGSKSASHLKKTDAKSLKRKREVDEHDRLEKAVAELDPKLPVKDFTDLPLSEPTLKGLGASHFRTLTEIQSKAIPLALSGRDILGAAKTGSGKTLAFLIPVLENLYRKKWGDMDGLGALIVSPTRELAAQIFEVLRKVGRYHGFSAGLVIGGKDTVEEGERLGRMNIIVCTPGRMLRHLDQTAAFDISNLQILILDEADRVMDSGFHAAVDSIIDHMPRERQTMLFSATQTKKVSYLARLSLRDPEYVGVHEDASSATPEGLIQHYLVCPLPQKLNTLYGFIKAALKSKIVVFLSSGKEVRFVYESFRHLQPGIPLMHLLGNQKLSARLATTAKFSSSKAACMFATDVVARGLDFPAVDWVVQYDCPEDADTYIHRVGRTARYGKEGRAVLFLDPSEEEGMIKRLEHKKIPIQNIKIKQGKNVHDIKNQLMNMCFQDPELKYLGQKAFSSYVKSLQFQSDKTIFNVDKYDLSGYAASMGLPGVPNLPNGKLQKNVAKELKNAPRNTGDDSDSDRSEPKTKAPRTKIDRMFERRNQDVLSGHYSKMIAPESKASYADADADDDFLTVKRVVPVDESDSEHEEEQKVAPGSKVISVAGGKEVVIDSKRREKMLSSKKQMLKLKGNPTKLVFDDEGVAHQLYELEDEEEFRKRGPALEQRDKFVEEEAAKARLQDEEDKLAAKQKKREKRIKQKEKLRAELAGEDYEEGDPSDSKAAEESLAFLRSLPVASVGSEEDSEEDRPTKRPKKWFQDDSEDEGAAAARPRVIEAEDVPESLEDLEALAAGLLD